MSTSPAKSRAFQVLLATHRLILAHGDDGVEVCLARYLLENSARYQARLSQEELDELVAISNASISELKGEPVH